MNPDTALQTILMAKTSTDLQPIVEQVLLNPTYYYNDLLRSISRYGTDLDAKGLLDLTTVINALKKEHERRKNEAPSTSRSTEALPRDL